MLTPLSLLNRVARPPRLMLPRSVAALSATTQYALAPRG